MDFSQKRKSAKYPDIDHKTQKLNVNKLKGLNKDALVTFLRKKEVIIRGLVKNLGGKGNGGYRGT